MNTPEGNECADTLVKGALTACVAGCRRIRWSLLIAIAGLPSARGYIGVLGADHSPEIRIITDLTAEGRKIAPPSRSHPIVYLPVFSDDEPLPGVDKPSRSQVRAWLKQALAENGYECVSPSRDQPSQLLVFQWGEIVPEEDDQVWWNKGEMVDLVAGKPGQRKAYWEHLRLIGEATNPRFFVRVMAYDYAAAKKSQRVLLWHARISSYTDGVTMSGIMPTLIKLGGEYFGREQSRPLVRFVPLERPTKVELGETAVKEYLPPDGPGELPAPTEKSDRRRHRCE